MNELIKMKKMKKKMPKKMDTTIIMNKIIVILMRLRRR